jgi:hypothetical protein
VAVIRRLLQEDEIVGGRDVAGVFLDLEAAALGGLDEGCAVVAALKVVT